jgi:hypothetical protein
MIALGELDQLERRAGPVPAARGFLDPGVVDVARHPRFDELVLLR